MPRALITGGATRVGAAITRAVAGAGYATCIHYNSSEAKARALKDECGAELIWQADLSDDATLRSQIEALRETGFSPDLVVFNASQFIPDRVFDMKTRFYLEMQQTNLLSTIQLLTLLQQARAQPLTVIFILDQKVEHLNPDFFSYTATKILMHKLVELLALEPDFAGSRIYGVAPGLMLPSYDQTQEEFEESGTLNLRRRLNTAEEVAEACVFLAEGALANGSVLFTDSGQHLLSQPRDVMYLVREGAEA